jgi:hypothetical protein
MPILAPFFRELNLHRIIDLAEAGLSNSTIARVINDKPGNRPTMTAADVNGYLKMSKAGTAEMLVSAQAHKALKGEAKKSRKDTDNLVSE